MTSPTAPSVDIDTCDNEPIHIPGAIQPHGVLLALTAGSLVVQQVAGDTQGVLGATPEELLGQSVETWLGAAQVARLQDALRVQRGLTRSLPMFEVILLKDGRMLDAFVHEGDGVTILEFERARATEGGDAGAAMRRLQSHLAGARTVAALLQGIADAVHAVTGFGRVMVYRFLPDGSGRVEAEARDAGVASFLGLHYPAADIPVQARALYLKNWLRLIPDVTYVPAPLQPLVHPATGRMLDLSQSVLRSVSPIHLEYLSNMGAMVINPATRVS